jgi:surface antigen
MSISRYLAGLFLTASWCVPAAHAQSSAENPAPPAAASPGHFTCTEVPREDADPCLCAPALRVEDADDETPAARLPPVKIELDVPSGTPLRIALDQRTRIAHPGEAVHGKVVETVYAFDQAVIPAGSIVTGHVTKIARVSTKTRTLAYTNGNFSPFHKYEVTFDQLTLPDGKQFAIRTSVLPGTAEVVHLVSNPEKEKRKNAAARAVENAEKEAKGKIHEAVAEIKSPGRMQRLKQYLLAQLPYRRQYLDAGTRFNASLDEALSFGETARTRDELAALGSAPAPESTLHARLVAEVSSATAQRGSPVTAILTEPLYSPGHQLILPANSRLVGEVIQAKPARKLHRNGELRVIFERIDTPEGLTQTMQGSLEGVVVDRNARMVLDEEGGAHTADTRSRYLSTALVVSLAAWGTHPEYEHGTVSIADSAGKQAGAGFSGFKFGGALVSMAARSAPVSIAFGAYGASASIYANLLSRGKDIVLPKDTPLEIGFGNPHPTGGQSKTP